jgi:hypothetical protein
LGQTSAPASPMKADRWILLNIKEKNWWAL